MLNKEDRIKILNVIFDNFQQITQWIPNHLERANYYSCKAETLIEYLEIEDCGQIGGYDENNPREYTSGFELYDRFLTLINKSNQQDEIEKCCNFTLDKMTDYFKIVHELRESFREKK